MKRQACGQWSDTRHCGAVDGVRQYIIGPRCPEHTPAALAGRPEPEPGQCAPGRHYCLAAGTPCANAPPNARRDEPGTPRPE